MATSRIAYAACPLCESREIAFLREDDCTRHPLYRPVVGPRIAWRRCAACTHVFTSGYFTPEAASEIFSSTLPHQTRGADAEAQRYVSARMVERVARHVSGGVDALRAPGFETHEIDMAKVDAQHGIAAVEAARCAAGQSLLG